MRKTRMEKGITLIALIITIVVLLILAAVAISSIQNDGILGHATNAAKDYNQAVANESQMLQNYTDFLDKYNGGATTYEAYEVGDIVTIGSEEFFVIADSAETQEKVTLLAKYYIDPTNLVQTTTTDSKTQYDIEFSSTNYWHTEDIPVYEDEYESVLYVEPFDLTETGVPDATHYAAKAAYDYGIKIGGAGRLMTYTEGNQLFSAQEESVYMYGNFCFWLSCAESEEIVYKLYTTSDGGVISDWFKAGEVFVRPVIEISKTLISTSDDV